MPTFLIKHNPHIRSPLVYKTLACESDLLNGILVIELDNRNITISQKVYTTN